MFKSPKITALAVAGSVFVLLLTITFFSRTGNKQAPGATPKIPDLYSGSLKIDAKFSQEDFGFPGYLPFLDISQGNYSSDQVKQIAVSLGFKSDPIIAQDTQLGTTYLYNSGTVSLIAVPQRGKIDYQLNSRPSAINKQLGNQELIDIATKFLNDNSVINKDDLNFSSFGYFVRNSSERLQPVSKSSAQIIQLNFSSKATTYPILALTPQSSPINVRVLPDGSIYSFSVLKYTAKPGEIKHKIKNYNDTISSLKDSKVITIDNGNRNPTDLTKDSIRSVTVEKIELFYLLDSLESSSLQPVFKLTGKAQISGVKDPLGIELYLPAVI
ncbi:hypothetical protein HY045_03770 [Candidatus Woesebacteria bacterium]|nr:hypothetical protein [Candidatus Woesebacteria bacterium]